MLMLLQLVDSLAKELIKPTLVLLVLFMIAKWMSQAVTYVFKRRQMPSRVLDLVVILKWNLCNDSLVGQD
jgi:hypothetical protein